MRCSSIIGGQRPVIEERLPFARLLPSWNASRGYSARWKKKGTVEESLALERRSHRYTFPLI